MTDFWEANLSAIRKFKPELYPKVSADSNELVDSIQMTPSRWPTVRLSSGQAGNQTDIWAHNPQDPWQDASEHLKTVRPGFNGLVVFIGMGLGYGPLLVAQKAPDMKMMMVVEPSMEMFCAALHALDLRFLLSKPDVHFFVPPIDWDLFETAVSHIAALEDTCLLRHSPSFKWRRSQYEPVNVRVFDIINRLNVSGATINEFAKQFIANRFANLVQVRRTLLIGMLKDCFKNRPAMVISSGPSLTESLPQIKKASGKCVLIAADGALAPLLSAGIMPDFVTSVDPKDLTFEKVAPFVGSSWPFHLVVLPKTTPLISQRLCVKQLFIAPEDDMPQLWLNKALSADMTTPAGSAVIHLSLGLAVIAGADPVIMVGQDLSYPPTDKQHASGVINVRYDDPDEALTAQGVKGQSVRTDRSFLEARGRIEDIIQDYPRKYYNTSPFGLHIQGTVSIDIASAVNEFATIPFESQTIVQQVIDASRSPDPAQLLNTLRTGLAQIKSARQRLSELSEKCDRIIDTVRTLQSQKKIIRNSSQCPKALTDLLPAFHDLNKTVEKYTSIWEQTAELTFHFHSENERLKQENQKRQSQDYLAWLTAEMQRSKKISEVRLNALDIYEPLLQVFKDHLEDEQILLHQIAKAPALDEHKLALARLYISSGQYVSAQNIIDSLETQNPDDSHFHLISGMIFCGLFDFKEARIAFDKALILDPNLSHRIDAFYNEQIKFWAERIKIFGTRRPKLMHACLDRILKINPPTEIFMSELSELWQNDRKTLPQMIQTGKLEPAGRILLSWEPIQKHLNGWLELKIHLLKHHSGIESALEFLINGLSQDAQQPEWMIQLAKLLFDQGNFDQGLEYIAHAVRIDPSFATIYEEIGDTLYAAQDFESAATAYEKCFTALPDRVDALCKFGHTFLKRGLFEAAQNAYEAVLSRHPTHENAQKSIKSVVLARQNKATS